MNTNEKEIIKRIITIAKLAWKRMTSDEQEVWYCTTGTYGFIEEIFVLTKHEDLLNSLGIDEFEKIYQAIFKGGNV